MNIDETVGEFLVGLLVFGGGPTVIAYAIFRFLGEKWIESKFAAQLEHVRHAHAKELHELRKKLDGELNRIVKIQDREFSVLPEAWVHLQDALVATSIIVSLSRQYPDLSRMSPERLEEFASTSRLTKVHREELRKSNDKNKYYQDIIFWYDLHAAKEAYRAFHTFINKNSIFLRPELKCAFLKIDSIMWDALISREVGQESNDHKFWIDASRKMREDIEPSIKELEAQVQAVLHRGE